MINRLFRIIKSNIEYMIHQPDELLHSNNDSFGNQQKSTHEESSSDNQRSTTNSDEKQFIDDLAYFGLQPPSSLKEVTAARNREMLKFHPDKFASNAEKSDVANEIALIYNAAYDRLKKHYSS